MDSKKTTEFITCNICFEIAFDPYDCPNCSCLVCSKCEKLLRKNTCPQCRKTYALKPNNFAKRFIDQIECECPNKCPAKLTYGDLLAHNDKCELKIYECKLIHTCQFKGQRKEFLEHLNTEHIVDLLEFGENRWVKKQQPHPIPLQSAELS